MTIKDKIAAKGEMECSYCGKRKIAIAFPPVSVTDMIVVCRDCICELLEELLK